MRETRADTRVAFVAALALHALLFALLFVGMWWTRTTAPVSAAGPEIEADLVDPNALSAPLRRALEAPAQREPEPVPVRPEPEPVAPPPQPEPEPRPEDSQVAPQPIAQQPVPVPDTREQERVEREAEAARQAAREQEEKRRQEQIDLTERKRQDEAEKKQRFAQQEIARKLEKIRAEREKAKRAADLAEQKLKQIADARAAAQPAQPSASTAAPPPGNNGVDSALAARYAAALTDAIQRNWTRPDSVPLGQRCVINIRQIPGGQVISAKVDPSCPYDEPGRRSIEAAVLKAQPLPYAGFESVFNRNLRLNFEARDR